MMYFIEYSNGKIHSFPFVDMKTSREHFHNEGDHALAWWVE